jgi:uncharacterized Fe-S center protein
MTLSERIDKVDPIHTAMLAKSANAKDCGYSTVIMLGNAVSVAKELIEQARKEEIKYAQLFTAGRTYSDATDWKHEVELYETMLENRLAELNHNKGTKS